MRRTTTRTLATFMTIAMLFSMLTSSAFAATKSTENTNEIELISISETDITREEAIELLDLTADEAETMDFYTVSAADSSALGYGVHDLGTFNFTNSNGGSYRTINGTKVMYAIQYKNFPSPSGYYTYMWVHFVQYGGTIFDRLLCQPGVNSDSGPDSNGFYTFRSDWIDVNYGVDYRFMYYLYTLGDADGTEYPIDATVRVVLAVYNA